MKKKIGFLSFGHWRPVDGSQTRTAADALRQTIELAQAAEEIGILDTIARHVAPAIGWTPARAATAA